MSCRPTRRAVDAGMAYQLGILFAAPTNTIEYALRERFGYQWALAGFEVVTNRGAGAAVVARRGRAQPELW